MNRALGLALAVLVAAAEGAAAPAPVELISNRATYEVSLDHALAGGIVAVRGRTVIEVRDTCDGWETTERFVMDTTDADSHVSRSDFVISAWESKTGQTMRFDITNMVDGQIAERDKGSATQDADGVGDVALTVPDVAHFALPSGTIFPMRQTAEILQAAAAGKSSLYGPVFQGGDKTDLYDYAASIGKAVAAGDPSREGAEGAADLLGGVAAWPVLMSYFSDTPDSMTPDYEVAARLYANGVIGSMSLIYRRFTLTAKLTKLERLAPHC